MIYRDDHVLIATRDEAHGPLHFEVECPYNADPEKRRGKCGYLESCACGDALAADREALEQLLGEDSAASELDIYDWIAGCFIPLGRDGKPRPTVHEVDGVTVRIDVPSHEQCPHTPGQDHHEWEGEVMVSGTQCGVAEEVRGSGADLLDQCGVMIAEPGRYPITFTWHGEDGLEIQLAEPAGAVAP